MQSLHIISDLEKSENKYSKMQILKIEKLEATSSFERTNNDLETSNIYHKQNNKFGDVNIKSDEQSKS